MTFSQLAELERRRHCGGGLSFSLYVGVEPTVVGLQNFNELAGGEAPASPLWSAKTHGQYSVPAVFWSTDLWPVLRVDVPTSTWVQQVLPRLGYDRARFMEVKFPPPVPGMPSAAERFDEARASLDACRYEECIAACRDVLEVWERHLGANRSNTVASILASHFDWPEGDAKRGLIDDL